MTELERIPSGELARLDEALAKAREGIDMAAAGVTMFAHGWVQWAGAADDIRVNKLYKLRRNDDGKPMTWEQFVGDEWGITEQSAYQRISAAKFLAKMHQENLNLDLGFEDDAYAFPQLFTHVKELKAAGDAKRALEVWREKLMPQLNNGSMSTDRLRAILRGEDPKAESGEVIDAEEVEPAKPPETTKIKIGNKEYTPEEAKKLVSDLRKEKKELKAASEGARQAELNLQKQIDERIAAAEESFKAEVARLKAKYDDDAPLEFMDIPEDAWIRMAEEARDVRTVEAGKLLRDLFTAWPERMGEYMPGEAAQAALRMNDSDKILVTLEFVHRWIGGVIEEMENEESLSAQRARRRA
jgi:hypothetical protein